MKSQKTYQKLIALFVMGVTLSLTHLQQAAAFTLIETQFLPAVQLGASQAVQVSSSNFSSAPVSIAINIMNSAGTVVMTKTSTVAASKTLVLKFTNGNTTGSYSAVVGVSAASAVTSDFQVLSSNSEVAVVILPYLELPAVQDLGGVRLIPGQSAVAAVTNFSTTSMQFKLTVVDNSGHVVLTQTETAAAGQTITFPFSNTGTANNGYRAVVSSAANAVLSDIMTLDTHTGLIIVVVFPPVPCIA